MDLNGQVALVTGASRGIGRAVALALAAAGADVACAARATDDAPLKLPGTIDATVREVEAEGRRGLAIPTNLAVEVDVERMVRVTLERFGRLDMLVNNAAINFAGDLHMAMQRFDLIMNVNLRAPLIALRAVTPHMIARGGGKVLNISSEAALSVWGGMMAYGVSKAALERLSIDAAEQLRPHHIAVNVFRIDLPVASEGFLHNAPGVDHSSWEPTEVAAEGIVWMLRQPMSYTGRLDGMRELRHAHGIMTSRARQPFDPSRFTL